jgi:hypothetical protein
MLGAILTADEELPADALAHLDDRREERKRRRDADRRLFPLRGIGHRLDERSGPLFREIHLPVCDQ